MSLPTSSHTPMTLEDADFRDDASYRVVRLSGSYEKYTAIEELLLRLYQGGGVRFYALSSKGKPKQFFLTRDQVEAFLTAWQQFQADEQAAILAEEQRQREIILHARARARLLPEIVEISGDDDARHWRVSVPQLTWERINISLPTVLLRFVNEAISTWIGHIGYLETCRKRDWHGIDVDEREEKEALLEQYAYLLDSPEILDDTPTDTDQVDELEDHPF